MVLMMLTNDLRRLNQFTPHKTQAWATPLPHPPNVRGPPKGRRQREGGEEKGKSGNSSEDTSSTGAGPMTTAADIQEQASEIELSMLSRDGD